MKNILADTSEEVMTEAIEQNLIEFFASFGNWHRASIDVRPDYTCVRSDVPSPMFNHVLRARIAPQKMEGTLDSIMDGFVAKGLPFAWWTGPQTQPSNLGQHLLERGLITLGGSRGMAADLHKIKDGFATPAAFEIKRVEDTETLRRWSSTFITGFGLPQTAVDGMVDLFSSLGLADELPIRHYIGLLEGRAVATSTLFLGAGVAGIYYVATLKEARNRGIGTAITLAPLLAARAIGYRVGILQASEMGCPVYRRIGFEQYCDIGHYIYRKRARQNHDESE